jgi:hypothetical protein
MTSAFKLDRSGVGEILKHQTRELIDDTAAEVAAIVRADVADEDVAVLVQSHTSDRATASVTIAGPQGLELQAKRGSLTKAAAALGLEVKSR